MKKIILYCLISVLLLVGCSKEEPKNNIPESEIQKIQDEIDKANDGIGQDEINKVTQEVEKIEKTPEEQFQEIIERDREKQLEEEERVKQLLAELENRPTAPVEISADPADIQALVSTYADAKTGDYITFGAFEQDNDTSNGAEPIEWRVLSNDGSELYILSKYVLYGIGRSWGEDVNAPITWKTCKFRKWLNGDFYREAFNDVEKSVIKETEIKSSDNEESGTSGDNDTIDKIFLPSVEEVCNIEYGFNGDILAHDEARKGVPTEYAVENKVGRADISGNSGDAFKNEEGLYTCNWWLRTQGGYESYLVNVDYFGAIYESGHGLEYYFGIRPALIIKLQ